MNMITDFVMHLAITHPELWCFSPSNEGTREQSLLPKKKKTSSASSAELNSCCASMLLSSDHLLSMCSVWELASIWIWLVSNNTTVADITVAVWGYFVACKQSSGSRGYGHWVMWADDFILSSLNILRCLTIVLTKLVTFLNKMHT